MYFIKEGYTERLNPQYNNDTPNGYSGEVYQPDVYLKAFNLARELHADNIIDVGCGNAFKLKDVMQEFDIIGVDYGDNIEFCEENYPSCRWIACDLEAKTPRIAKKLLEDSVIIFSDVVEHLINPTPILEWIKNSRAKAVVISTPDRELLDPVILRSDGPPWNPSHVREWTLGEFVQYLESLDFKIVEANHTRNEVARARLETITVVIRKEE